ncbi:MAG: NB-ARC domain-containing protein [Actinomycetota bacterium]
MTWPPWSRNDPQGLARFVTPEARKWLTLNVRAFDTEPTREGRLGVVQAIYDSLVAAEIRYALEEYDPSEHQQQVREPPDILRSPHEGTCLDLAALFCGLAMGNRLLPILVVLEGHALALVSLTHGLADWNGYRPEREWFDKGPVDDAERYEQLVALVRRGDFVAVECTGFASSDRLSVSSSSPFPETVGRVNGCLPFTRATEAGAEQLTLSSRPLAFALDIATAHFHWRIDPHIGTSDPSLGLPTPREAPRAPGVLVGRAAEIEEMKAAIRSSEPVTAVYGMAGVGKTALVQTVATDPEIEALFPDGTFWFDLRAIDVMTALEHMALAFGRTVAEHVVPEARAAQVRSYLHDKRLLVVLDGVWDRQSVDNLTPTCEHAAVLVTTIDGALAFDLGTAVHVEPLSDVDAALFLEAMIERPLKDADKQELQRAVSLLGGLTLALELAGKCLAKQLEMRRGTVKDFVDLLDAETSRLGLGTRDRQVRATFTSTYRHALDDSRRRSFAQLGAFLPGTLELGLVAAGWGVDLGQAAQQLGELVDLSLVEQPAPRFFRLPPLLRDYAAELFAGLDPSEQAEVHGRAAEWFRRWIDDYVTTHQKQTLCWYRVERPDWQRSNTRLLFHMSQLPARDVARLAFARLYFDVFWWWGTYVRLEYCEQLLVDWGHRCTDSEDRRWYDVLAGFARSYPVGAAKRAQGDWIDVERSLTLLRTLAGIDQASSALPSEDARRVRAITDLFMAQASRYLDRADDAYERYTASVSVLQQRNDWWDAAWALVDQADLLVEQNRFADAGPVVRQALAICIEHDTFDIELRSNLYRIEADIAWARGDVAQAFESYGKGVFYAYRLQCTPHPPDVYTLTFYREMRDRIRVRVEELISTERSADVDAGVNVLKQMWSGAATPSAAPQPEDFPRSGTGSGADLVARLFPAEPSERRLTARSVSYAQKFANDVRARTDVMVPAFDEAAWRLD